VFLGFPTSFSASVSTDVALPGTVTIFLDTTPPVALCTFSVTTTSSGTCDYLSPDAGVWTNVKSKFVSDSWYWAEGVSDAQTMTITRRPTSVTLSAQPAQIKFGKTVTLTATLTTQDGSLVDGGSLALLDNGIPVAGYESIALTGNQAILTLTNLARQDAAHSFSVSYTGTILYAASASSPVAVTVVRAPYFWIFKNLRKGSLPAVLSATTARDTVLKNIRGPYIIPPRRTFNLFNATAYSFALSSSQPTTTTRANSTIRINFSPSATSLPVFLYVVAWVPGEYRFHIPFKIMSSNIKVSVPRVGRLIVPKNKLFSGILRFPKGLTKLQWRGIPKDNHADIEFTIAWVFPSV
jgi:hypothetical protein